MKTGAARLDVDQLNTYWDAAFAETIDNVIRISHEIAPKPNEERPVVNSSVQVFQQSWTVIITAAVGLMQRPEVRQPTPGTGPGKDTEDFHPAYRES